MWIGEAPSKYPATMRSFEETFDSYNSGEKFVGMMMLWDAEFGLGLFDQSKELPFYMRHSREINRELITLCHAIVPEFRDSVRKKGKFGNPKEWLQTLAKLEENVLSHGHNSGIRSPRNNSDFLTNYAAWAKAGKKDGSFIIHCCKEHSKVVSNITKAIVRNRGGHLPASLENHIYPDMGSGRFACPIILTSEMFEDPKYLETNFQNGISPRWTHIVNEIVRHPDKWESGYMKHGITAKFPKGFTSTHPFMEAEHGVYEIWRVIRGATSVDDSREVLMVRVGFSQGLYYDNADITRNLGVLHTGGRHGVGRNPPLAQKIGMGTRMVGSPNVRTPHRGGQEMWQYSQCNKDFDPKTGENKDWFPTGFEMAKMFATNHGQEGMNIFKILPRQITMQTKNQNPMALKANFVKTGDYVALVGRASMNPQSQIALSQNLGVRTVPCNDAGNVHEFVIEATGEVNRQFIHIPQMRVALGRPYHPEHGKWTKEQFPYASPKAKSLVGNPKKGKIRFFEPMAATELMTMTMGMVTAINEGEIMQEQTMEEEKATEFIPTWKDNRPKKTVSKTKGTPFFTDVIRCEVCNGRNLVRLPKTPPYANVECGHCGAPEGVICVHLNVDSPGIEIEEPQPYR